MEAISRAISPLRPDSDDPAADVDLVARARDGATWAAGELFRRHAGRVAGLLTRLLGSTAEAEDATQDAFVEALRDLGRLEVPAAFGGWLTRIAVHQAHRRFRRRRLLSLLGLDRHVEDAALELIASPQASPEARAELARIGRALERLPAAERLAWSLRHVEGYELAEVAAACDCSLATVKRRIAAAQARIAPRAGGVEDSDG